jgi:hypothetical protein
MCEAAPTAAATVILVKDGARLLKETKYHNLTLNSHHHTKEFSLYRFNSSVHLLPNLPRLSRI